MRPARLGQTHSTRLVCVGKVEDGAKTKATVCPNLSPKLEWNRPIARQARVFSPLTLFPHRSTYGPAAHHFLSCGIGQRAAVNQVPQITPKREEVDDARPDSTWPGWPAESRAGFCSVMLAGSPSAVPHGTTDQPDYSLTPSRRGELTPA